MLLQARPKTSSVVHIATIASSTVVGHYRHDLLYIFENISMLTTQMRGSQNNETPVFLLEPEMMPL